MDKHVTSYWKRVSVATLMVGLVGMYGWQAPLAQADQTTHVVQTFPVQIQLHPVHQSGPVLFGHKEIRVGGKDFAQVSSFSLNGTTYMPIWYVMQVLKHLGLDNQWDGSRWNVSAPNGVHLPVAQGGGDASILVNGHSVYRVQKLVKQGTTFMPVWYIMNILKMVGVDNTWSGDVWSISGGNGTSGTSGGVSSTEGNLQPSLAQGAAVTPSQPLAELINGVAIAGGLPNHASPDETYWQRASKDFFLQVSTSASWNLSQNSPLENLQPGQTVQLLAYAGSADVTQTQWLVNSPDGHFGPGPSNISYSINQYHATAETFTADKPGIYTLQAVADGKYSVPLVLLVGVPQLQGTPIQVPPQETGILPMPAGLQPTTSGTVDSFRYQLYPLQSGWMPISGSAPTGVQNVDVYLSAGVGQWVYTLPVTHGQFAGEVRVPFTGNVQVGLTGDLITQLNQNNSTFSLYPMGTVSNPVGMSPQQQGLLYSSFFNSNQSPALERLASILAENSPSQDTAIAAIANYASWATRYDFVDYQQKKTVWHNAAEVFNGHLGVCQDISDLAAAMLKSVGVPVQTVIGKSSPNEAVDDHEWLQAWNGTAWVLDDPTFGQETSENGNQYIDTFTNAYTTATTALASHIPDPAQVGTFK